MALHSPVRILRSLLFVLAMLALHAPAQAQAPESSPEAIAMATEIINIKGSGAGYNAVVTSVIERAKAMLLQTNPMYSKDLTEVALQLRKDYADVAKEPLADAAKLYASKFTEDELKAILAFYKSAAGTKVIEQEPVIFEQSMQSLDAWSEKLSQDVLIKFRDEMRKRGHNL